MTVHRLKYTVLAVVASVFGAAFGDIVSPARLGDFRFKVPITVTKTVAYTEAGVPVPVRLAENNPGGFSYADCDPTQMRFGDENYAPIPFEVDTWNPQGESLVWVKVPLAEGTKINLVYNGTATVANDPSAVWGDYTGVWHFETLDESVKVTNAQGTYPNSTAAEGIDGNVSTYSVPGEPGRFGNCFRVNDSTGYKEGNFNNGGVWVNDAGTASPVDGGENFTISGWFKHGNFQYFYDHFFYKREKSNNSGTLNNAFAIESNSSSGNNANPYPRGSSVTGSAVTLSNNLLDTWGYITFAYEGTTCHVYENGVLRGDVTITKCIDNDSPLVFGDNSNVTAGGGDAAWNGWIDEVRFAKGTKSAEFIAAEYAAMTTDGLLEYGAVETADPSAIVVSSNIGACGTVSPDYGAIEGPVAGQEYVFACTDTTGILVEDAKRGVCTGWKLVDAGTGELLRSSLDEGEDPFVCRHVYQAGKGVSLEWQWRVEYRVAATVAPSQGGVELSGEWFATGEKVTAKATAESGSTFLYWTGDGVTDDNKNDNPLTLTVGTAAIGLTPVFSSSIFVSPTGSDENSGKSWDEALATIHAALAKGPILTVFLAEGLYDVQAAAQVENQVQIVGSGERASVVRLAAEPADTNDRDKEQAVFYLNNANARLENLAITTGGKTYGRGVYVANGRVENCSITNCVTINGRFNGAGIYMKSGSVCNCFINDNMASSSGGNNKEGGGIYMEGGLVENCTISSNYACYGRGGSGSGNGGGVRIKGGTLRSSLVVGNLAHGEGSGVNASGDTSVVENCTVVKNDNLTRTSTSGLYASGKTVVRNTIVRYNRNTAGEANVYRDSTATFDRVCTTDEAGETGVIAAAPVFADAEGGDWRLTYCSCVDAGADMPWMAGATDLDGAARIAGEHVDIGCYEFVATGLACSFNVTTDGVLDEAQATFAGSVIGAAPEAVTFSWTIVDSAGNKTERSGLGLKDFTLPLTKGAYTVTLAVTDGVNSVSVTRTDAVRVFATNLYVSPTGANTLPYGDFATAATNLLDALAFAADGSTVHLSDGIHRVSDKIVLTKAVTLTHEGDREACIVTGNTGGSLVVLDNAEAHLEGLDLCGQYPRLVFNATLDQRPVSAYDTTHGVQIVSGGSVSNCVVESCRTTDHGAGVYMSAGTVVDTVIRGNYAYSTGGGGASGAGIFMDGGLVDRCIITNNLAWYGSGAQGGGAYVKGGGTLRNTLVAYNYGSSAGGVWVLGASKLENCTVFGNSSGKEGAAGGVQMGDKYGLAVNTIVWQNTNTVDGVVRETAGEDAQFDTCWKQDPLFLPHGKPFRLRTASPCRDAAKTLDWMGGSVDIYGNPRIRCQKPDIGATEGASGFILSVK
ncbi:MAG: LamG-like jellyroll fold domain-containing protein [Kiritimatiellia bacterium]